MFKTILGLAQVKSRENVEINKQYMSSFGWIELRFDLNLIYSRNSSEMTCLFLYVIFASKNDR